jgi:hypothetical protein
MLSNVAEAAGCDRRPEPPVPAGRHHPTGRCLCRRHPLGARAAWQGRSRGAGGKTAILVACENNNGRPERHESRRASHRTASGRSRNKPLRPSKPCMLRPLPRSRYLPETIIISLKSRRRNWLMVFNLKHISKEIFFHSTIAICFRVNFTQIPIKFKLSLIM